ncbi:MAG: hypothetical protein U5K72_10630 [Balneolaceae bacterium]|nr:hypothetical protein [Balneolaceae bacterium]
MIQFRNKISIFILAVAALGLLSSLMHYHSYTLDCLEHAGESHYTEYELVCPVCALHVHLDSDDSRTFYTDLEFKEYIVNTDDILLLQENYDSPLGRSPPHIA